MASSKGSATAYSDFYKNNSSDGASVGDNTNTSTPTDSTDITGDKLRKRALQKRLKLMKMKAS